MSKKQKKFREYLRDEWGGKSDRNEMLNKKKKDMERKNRRKLKRKWEDDA